MNRLAVVLAAAAFAGCSAGHAAGVMPAERGAARVAGQVSVALPLRRAGLEGNLGVYWATAAEWDDVRHGRHVIGTLIRMMARTVPLRAVDPAAAPVPFDLDVPPGEVVVFAVLDRSHDFLRTVLEEGGAGNLRGATAEPVRAEPGRTARIDLVLADEVRPRAGEERCAGPRLRLERVHAPQVAGSSGNAIDRRLCVALPASYTAAPDRRYPVIYVLPGLFSTDASGPFFEVGRALDALAPTGAEAIVVGVDTSTRWGSTYFERSPAGGDFESFLARDVVARVDGRYRTVPEASRRALLGHSTGGFNAVSMGLRHPDVFQVVVASAPDGLDLERWLLTPGGERLRPEFLGLMRVEEAFGSPGQMASYAADWSPDTEGGLRWPARLDTGEVVPAVWARWRRASPLALLADPAIREAARARLSRHVYLAASPSDESLLFEPAHRFSEALTAAGIAHTFASDDEGHFDDARRVREMVAFALSALGDGAPR